MDRLELFIAMMQAKIEMTEMVEIDGTYLDGLQLALADAEIVRDVSDEMAADWGRQLREPV